MTKRERVLAATKRLPVDRPPVAFWRHAPDVDHTAAGLAGAMLDFHRRWDLDLIKIMSSGVYCVEDWGCRVAYQGSPNGAKTCTDHAVKTTADWDRLRTLDPGAGALGRELEALRLIVRGRGDDAPALHTLFSPLTIARKLAGDRLDADLAAQPGTVEAALEVIATTVTRYAAASAPRRKSTIALVGAPGVKTSATPSRLSSSASSTGIVPPTTTSTSSASFARSPSTIRGTSVMCAPERIEMPTASASSWIAVSTICSGVWWRPV